MTIAIGSIATSATIDSSPLNTIFSNYGNEINRVGGIVDAATPNAGTGTIVKRPTTTGATLSLDTVATNALTNAFGLTTATMTATGNATVGGQITAGSSAVVITNAAGFLDMTKGVNALPVANGGTGTSSLTSGGVLIGGGGGAVSAVAPGAAGTVLSSTGATWAGTAFTASLLGDYKATPGSAGQVTVAAGGPWEDSNGQFIAALGAQTANMPAQPAGTNTQYVAITLAPTTGAPIVTAAAVNAAVSTLAIPLLNKPIAVVLLRGATTNPGYVIAAADIFDIRFGSGGGGGGGGGTSGVAASAAMITNGNLTGLYSNSVDIANVLSSNWTPAAGSADTVARLKSKPTDAALSDAILNSTNGPWRSAWGVSGASATLNSNNGRLFLDGGPLGRRFSDQTVNPGGTTTLTSANQIGGGNGVGAASGASAATYNVYADFGGTGPGFGITMFRQGAVVSGSVVGPLATVLWDGTSLIAQSVTPLTDGIARSASVARDSVTTPFFQSAAGALTASQWTDLSTSVQAFYSNAVPMKGRVVICGSVNCTTATTVVQLTVDQDTNIWTDQAYNFTLLAGQAVPFSLEYYFDNAHQLAPAVAGQHYFRAAAFTASPANISFTNVKIHVEFENAG